MQRPVALTSYKLFQNTKRCLELVLQPHFLHGFSKKYLSCYILLTDQILLSDYLNLVRYKAISVL